MVNLVPILLIFLLSGVLGEDYCKWEWICPSKSDYLNNKHENVKQTSSGFKYAGPVITVPIIGDDSDIINPFDGNTLPEVSLRMPQFSVEPVEVTCKSTMFARNVRNLRKKIRCTPRYVLVDVVSDEGKVIPNKVATKLCSGLCTGEKSCVATKSVNMSLSVRVEMENGKIKCSTISIPQDIKCKCGCEDSKSKDCTPAQTYMMRNCKCQCTNEQDFIQCAKKSQITNKHKWDPDKCMCACKHPRLCTTGTYWDDNECRCKI